MIIKEEQIDNLDNQDLSVVATKTLIRKFGKPEDNVELFVYDLNGNLLLNRENFRGYKPPDNITDPNGLYNEINIDYTQTLKTLGFTSGEYQLILGFYRKVILNSFVKPFYISEISPSRREIKIKSDLLSDEDVIKGFNDLIGVIEASSYFREFILNFGNNIQSTGINFQIDSITEPTEVLIKLYDPLPNTINVKSKFRLTEEIINPVSITVDLGEPTLDQLIVGEEIKGPNLRIDTRLNSSKPSAFRTYDQILGGSNSSSFANISNYLSSSLELAIDFEDIDTDSGYHFENFIHFSSAVERLKNFRYKLQLVETYDGEINDIDTLEGSQTSSVVVIAERDRIEKKKNSLIGNFDAYERFLYYESGTYAWPKTTSARPFTLANTNTNEAKAWIGSEVYTSGYYGGQLLSGSEYDDINIHRLTDTLPEHVVSNNDNDQYTLFVNMVAQHFDSIWIYIDHITNINQAENKLNRGISKDMVYDILERAGLKVFDQFENDNLFGYIAANEGANGNFQYQAPTGQTMISASAAGSIPKGDITKEVWKRLYHNLPYLLKTKGTERGMKALISCYGIPESILNIKEYGGPNVDKTNFRTFSYQKSSKFTNNFSSSVAIAYNSTPLTSQVRHLPPTASDNHNYAIITSTQNGAETYQLSISKSVDDSKLDSGLLAYLVLRSGSATSNTVNQTVSSSLGAILNGDAWNFSLVITSGSTPNTVTAYATDNTFNKDIVTLSCSLEVPDSWLNGTFATQFHIGNFSTPYLGTSNENVFSGSLQEFRVYQEALTKNTVNSQALSPFNYNGNSISSSYENLLVRHPLGSNDTNTVTGLQNFAPKEYNRNNYSINIIGTPSPIEVLELHHLTTPDTVGKSMVSDKVRLDTGTIADDILSPFIRSEESTQDRQPNDFSDLGVFFSPTFEVNEDIIYTLGGFRMDDYIGDPRDYTSSFYPDLKALQDIYVQKIDNKIVNIWDYLKIVQQFDHTLFKMIEQFAPAKANLKTGVVIEPHYLERHKLKGLYINTDSTSYNLDLPGVLPPISSENSLHEIDIDVYGYLVTGSGGDIENNAVNNRLSSKFYTRVKPYNQLTQAGPPINPNTGDPVSDEAGSGR
tara:strand:+ start:20471 stop:23773 length:3303 start_codon:yes stop_codon:yes gene_type:complete